MVPTATSRSTSQPADSPVVSTPASPKPPRMTPWTTEMTTLSGMSSTPIPRKSDACFTYIRPADERI